LDGINFLVENCPQFQCFDISINNISDVDVRYGSDKKTRRVAVRFPVLFMSNFLGWLPPGEEIVFYQLKCYLLTHLALLASIIQSIMTSPLMPLGMFKESDD